MSTTAVSLAVLDETEKRPLVTCHQSGITAVLPEVRLASTIENIKSHLTVYFPGEHIVLKPGSQRVYIVVKTSLPEEEAKARIRLFVDEWWLSHRHKSICITIEFDGD